MPCGTLVHTCSPSELSEQNVLNSSDLYLTTTPASTGVPSVLTTLPVIWLVGCSFSVSAIVVGGDGIVCWSAIGSGLNWPAARIVNWPGQRPAIENAPVEKFVSTIWKF